MIFYFSGTGNSLDAAVKIAKLTGETRLYSIAKDTLNIVQSEIKTNNDTSANQIANQSNDTSSNQIRNKNHDTLPSQLNNENENSLQTGGDIFIEKGEKIGIVFPVYAWGPPKPVVEFIDKLMLSGITDNYIYAIATCGENIGNTMKVISKHLKVKNMSLNAAFSVVMPNNYIIASEVYPKPKEEQVLKDSYSYLEKIASVINKKENDVFILVKGPVPFLLTGVIHPLFNNAPLKTKPFYATDECNQCGICVNVCSCKNIEIKDTKPVWGNNCTQCLACINYCPTRAIQYGKSTIKRGRYTNPNYKRNYL